MHGKLVIGLVDDEEDRVGDSGDDPVERRLAHHAAAWRIGRTTEQEPRPFADRAGQGVGVIGAVGVKPGADRRRTENAA